MDPVLQATDLIEMYRLMRLTRRYTETALQMYRAGRLIQGLHPSIGQEAVGIGACYGLRQGDWVQPSLRTSEAFFARGVTMRQHLAAMNGRVTGISRGKETSHHAGYLKHGVLAGTGMVGSHIPVAVGAALALKMQGTDNVVINFFGDGASNRGDFHEGLNLAAVLQTPIVFVCENNRYAQTVPGRVGHIIDDIASRATGYGMPGVVVDGQDVLAVHEAVQAAVRQARAGGGPTLIECKTYRFEPHHVTFVEDRPLEEVARWKERDPIRLLGDKLLERGILTPAAIDEIAAKIEAEVEEAIRFAEESPWPPAEEALQHVFWEGDSETGKQKNKETGSQVDKETGKESVTHTHVQALNAALHEEMARDETVFVFGEDVALCGGLFKVTEGLLDRFGGTRVFDTPISESGIMGVAVGAAMLGLRPVLEIQFTDAVTVAMDQIVNSAAKACYAHAGELALPLVVRLLNLGTGTIYSSQALEAWFMHVPGLKVVMPATPADAYGLLKAAIRDPNPVIFIESRPLYGQTGAVASGEVTPLGQATVARAGQDVTVVAIGRLVPLALEAAEKLASQGVDIEVIDPRSLVPLDEATILASVRKTGRLVITHEAVKTAGPGAEIAALVAEKALASLRAPILRVANPGAPVPFSPALHAVVLPGTDDIIKAVQQVMA